MKRSFIYWGIWILLVSMASTSQAGEGKPKPNYPIIPYYDFNHPRTKDQVLNAYPWRVNTADGVDDIEARIIAQYEIVVRGLDNDYEVGKVKIVKEDLKEFIVQIPAKVSVNKKMAARYLVHIDKKDGKVLSLKED